MRSVVTHWKMGDANMAEWYEEISGEFSEFVGFCEEEAAKVSRELHEIIYPSDPLMCS